MNIQDTMRKAFELHQAGKLAEAEQLYRQVLAQQPNYADALHGLGVMAEQLGRSDLALQLLQRAVALNPNSSEYLANYGAVLQSLGRLDEAIAANQRAVAISPRNATAWSNLGNWLREAGKGHEAAAACRTALEIDPKVPEAHNNLGLALLQLGQSADAMTSYRRALELRPDFPEAIINLTGALLDEGRPQEALPLAQRAVALRPQSAPAQMNLGITLKQLGKRDEGIEALRRAVALDPGDADAYNNLGFALLGKGLVEESIQACRQAIALRPDFAEGLTNLGNALRVRGDLSEAIALFQRAAELRPDLPEPLCNLGAAMLDGGMVDEAVAACQAALKLDPTDEMTLSNLANVLQLRCDHDGAMDCFEQARKIDPSNPMIDANRLLAMQYRPAADPAQVAEAHRQWGRTFAAPLEPPHPAFANDRSPDRKLRIGYVSPDLWRHSIAFFLLPILQSHDRSQVEVTCYATGTRRDDVTEQLRSAADHWVDLVTLTDTQAAAQIARDQIDILVDLSGHTAFSRLLLFARRPAPVQVTYLGYPNTTGMTSMDWRLTDAIADPPGAEEFYTERLMRLPRTAWCFSPLSGSPPIVAPTRTNVVFGCYNHAPKLNAPLIELWAKILKSVPDSRLALKNRSTSAFSFQSWLKDKLAAHGIDFGRVDLLRRQFASADHIRSYEQIDIALDTYPYHGTTTTCEALWMGVPVVTLAGRTHHSRVGPSLLHSVGLDEWIAADPDQYVKLAVDLAADAGRRHELRSSLRDRMSSSPLMDAGGFCRDLETAYRQMWHAWLNR